jgi:hypothetical protein
METLVRLVVLAASLLGGWELYSWVWVAVPGAQVASGWPAVMATTVITQIAAGLILEAIYPSAAEG